MQTINALGVKWHHHPLPPKKTKPTPLSSHDKVVLFFLGWPRWQNELLCEKIWWAEMASPCDPGSMKYAGR